MILSAVVVHIILTTVDLMQTIANMILEGWNTLDAKVCSLLLMTQRYTECPQKLVTLLTCYYAIFYIIPVIFYMKYCFGDY